jgi:hypothetical protein
MLTRMNMLQLPGNSAFITEVSHQLLAYVAAFLGGTSAAMAVFTQN